MKKLWNWFTTLLSGKPHFYIGGKEDPYLLRWYLFPRNHWLNLYLHKFVRDDDDKALHCHPWWFVSIMIRGSYIEHTPSGVVTRRSPSLAFRSATHIHRVELLGPRESRHPCWTIVVTGPNERVWGFYPNGQFVKWCDFLGKDDEC